MDSADETGEDGLFNSLFGEDEIKKTKITITQRPGIFSDDRIIKLVKLPPRSVLDTLAFGGSEASSAAASKLLVRTTPDGQLESNARLVEWEDGSWTMHVGSEAFKVMERDEEVYIYSKHPEAMILDGVLKKQLIVTPSSLNSKTHRIVTQKTNQDRNEAAERRKTQLTAVMATPSLEASPAAPLPRTKRQASSLTADFLESDAMRTSSVKDLKESFKRRAIQQKQQAASRSSSSEGSSSDSSSDASSERSDSSDSSSYSSRSS